MLVWLVVGNPRRRGEPAWRSGLKPGIASVFRAAKHLAAIFGSRGRRIAIGRGPPTEHQSRLLVRIQALSAAHPQFGLRRIVALLRLEGWSISRKQVQRVRRAGTEGLRVPPPCKRQTRLGVSTGLPTRATHRGHLCAGNFIADATVHGGVLRMLTVLDEHTEEVHVLRPERRIGSADLIAMGKGAIAEHGAPEFIRSDNGHASTILHKRLCDRGSRPRAFSKRRFWIPQRMRILVALRASGPKTGSISEIFSRRSRSRAAQSKEEFLPRLMRAGISS